MADARSTFTYVLKSVTGDLERGFRKSATASSGLTKDLNKLEKESLDVREATLKLGMAQTRAAKAADRYGKESDQARMALIRQERAQEKLNRTTSRTHSLLGKSAGSLKKAALAGGALAASYVSIAGIKDAVNVTEDLGKTTLTLHKSFGMTIKSSAQWAAVQKARGTEGKALTMGFKKLATAVGAVTDADTKQAQALDALQRKNKVAIADAKAAGKSGDDLAAIRVKQARAEEALAQKVSGSAFQFQKLGISTAELRKHGGDLDWVLNAVADGMAKMPNKVDRASVASKLFGRTWLTVAPLLRDGSKGLQEQLALADEYGATLGGKTVDDVKKLIAAQREQKLAMLGIKVAIGSAVIPYLAKGSKAFAGFVKEMRNGKGAGGKFVDTVKDIAGPVVAVGKAIGGFVGRNPDLAKAAASFAIIGGASTKILKMSGLGGILKLGFGRGNTPVTPMFVKEVAPRVPGPGPRNGPTSVIPGVAKVAIAQVAAGVVLPVAAMGATGFLNQSKDTAPGSLAQQYNLPRQDGATRLVGKLGPFGSGDAYNSLTGGDQGALEKFGEKLNKLKGSLKSLDYTKLRGLRAEANKLRDAFPENTGLKRLVSNINAAMSGARSKIRGSWADVKNQTRITMSDVNRTVERNMGRVRRAMRVDSQAGAQALRSNINGAVTSVEKAMSRGTISVATGMRKINSLLSSELKQLGVTYLAADGKSPSIQAGALPKPTIDPQGSTGVVAPGVGTPESGGARIRGTGGPARDGTPSRDRARSSGGGGGNNFAASGAAAKLRDWLSKRGFATTSEGRRNSDTYHGMGLALDYGTSRNDLSKLAKVLWPARKQFEELFIPTWAPHGGLYHNGSKFSDAGLQADHQDHIHVAETGSFKAPEINIPRVKMRQGLGAVTNIGQAALNKVRRAAISYGNRQIGGASIKAPPYKNKYGIKELVQLALYGGFRGNNAAIAAAIAMAESGGVTKNASTAGNSPPSTDRGLWQINSYWNKNISDERAYSPTKAAKAAHSIFKSRGWKDWVVWRDKVPNYTAALPRAKAALKELEKSGTTTGGTKKKKSSTPTRADRIKTGTSWDAKQGARARFYESAYTIAIAKGDWTTAKMTVRGALLFWRGVRARALAKGDGETLTSADEKIADWNGRPTSLEAQRAASDSGSGDAGSVWASADGKSEMNYTLAKESGDPNWTANAAIAGYTAANTRVQQYTYGATHGDTRVTPEMLSGAISERDAWAERLTPSARAQFGLPPIDSGTGTAMTQEERDAILKAISEGITEMNDRAKLIGTTSGAVIAKAITDVVTGQIGGTVIQGVQTPLWAGTGSRY